MRSKIFPVTDHEDTEKKLRCSSTLSLTSPLDGESGQRHAPFPLPPEKRPGTHGVGGCVGPMAGPDECGKFYSHRDSIPGPSSPWRLRVKCITKLSRNLLEGT
jgi:hypothetical protein